MHMRPDETVIQKYRHHPFPFFLQMLLMGFATVILYAGLPFFFANSSADTLFMAQVILGIVLVLFLLHLTLMYWGDALVLTNYRLVSIDWKFFTLQTEEEINLYGIREVETVDHGLLNYIPLFNYGTVVVFSEGEARLTFPYAPAPDSIKHAILSYVPTTST